MLYQSTRGAETATPLQAVLKGMAGDGGLFVDPDLLSCKFDWLSCLKKAPLPRAAMILSALLPDFEDMPGLVERAYAGKFETPDITPLVDVGNMHVLELFRGPTAAFKDVALSMLPQLITAARTQTGMHQKIMILTATSGDTGKAALHGFADVSGTGIIVFYPSEGVSPIQKIQMITQPGENVRVCGVKGNFDDCQRGVKRAFAALNQAGIPAQNGAALSSANSINIGRLAPQVTYYFSAYGDLLARGQIRLGDPVDFVVPTGNFGDILAGFIARCMGLPVGRLVCASNANNVLTDFLRTGAYDQRRPFHRTSSPSMDILVSSNLERLLYYAADGDARRVSDWMGQLSENGYYRVDRETLRRIQAVFSAGCCDEAQTAQTIRRVWAERHYLCDPHTAVAFAVAERYMAEEKPGRPVVVLSTASPYKFPGAVLPALGGDPDGDAFAQMAALQALTGVPIPQSLQGLQTLPVRHFDCIAPLQLTDYVASHLAGKGE